MNFGKIMFLDQVFDALQPNKNNQNSKFSFFVGIKSANNQNLKSLTWHLAIEYSLTSDHGNACHWSA